MTTLRFRAWDKNGQWMAYGERENYDDMVAWRFRHWDFLTDGKEGLPDVVIMQSTGLQDLKGVEIFEDDVVAVRVHRRSGSHSTWYRKKNAHHNLFHVNARVVFLNGRFTLDYDKEAIEKLRQPMGHERITQVVQYPHPEHENWWTECEVIGNIHEHPSLFPA